MSHKIKSFLFLISFIAVFTIYNFSMTQTENNYSDSTEIAIAELDQVTPSHNLQIEKSE